MDIREKRKLVIEKLKQGEADLSEKEQAALAWVIGHAGLVEKILKEPIASEEGRTCMELALRTEDQFIPYILWYQQQLDALENVKEFSR